MDAYIATYPKNAVFPAGSELGALTAMNECSWLDAYLDARSAGNLQQQQVAISQFAKVSTRITESSDSEAHIAEIVRTAKAGDSVSVR